MYHLHDKRGDDGVHIDEASILSNLTRSEFIHMVNSGDINGMRHARAIAIRAKKAGEQNNSRKEWRKERGREEHNRSGFFRRRFIIDRVANDLVRKYDPRNAQNISEQFNSSAKRLKAISYSNFLNDRKGFTQDKLSDVEDVPSLVAVFNNTGRTGAMNAQLIAQRQKIKQFRQEANIVTNLKRKKTIDVTEQ